MWTAFEVFAADLWEQSLNTAPDPLAKLSATHVDSKAKSDVSATVDISNLAKHGFDVHNKMGTILREKLGFNKLARITEAYRKAFSSEPIKNIFETGTSPNPFDTLSFVRNLIVHKSGRVDAEFIERAVRHQHFKHLQVGDPLHLTGSIVNALLKDAFSLSCRLLTEVDGHIQTLVKKGAPPRGSKRKK